MIGAGLVLLAVGAADLVRLYVPVRRRWLGLGAAAVALLIVAAGADAVVWWLVSLGAAAVWLTGTPDRRGGRAGLWPIVLIAAVSAGAVAVGGVRAHQGPLAEAWPVATPLGAVTLDVAVFVVGALVFLLESGNVVVRAALRGGAVAESDGAALKGGRLIGPLERVLVFALTLAGAYPLLAAALAGKGIVRFPEISRDEEGGSRAEYFLVGSLVSWVTALAAAFLLWWGASAA